MGVVVTVLAVLVVLDDVKELIDSCVNWLEVGEGAEEGKQEVDGLEMTGKKNLARFGGGGAKSSWPVSYSERLVETTVARAEVSSWESAR